MELKEYFKNTKGVGVLSTADGEGRVDTAIYSRPYVFEDGTMAFIMRHRLTHYNLQSNSHAAYLFIEQGPGYKGKRLFLTKLEEEKETERVQKLHRRCRSPEEEDEKGPKFLVIFKVDRVLPLIGTGETAA
jgi:hypothetical protein